MFHTFITIRTGLGAKMTELPEHLELHQIECSKQVVQSATATEMPAQLNLNTPKSCKHGPSLFSPCFLEIDGCAVSGSIAEVQAAPAGTWKVIAFPPLLFKTLSFLQSLDWAWPQHGTGCNL